MAFANYTELKDEIESYLIRTDQTAKLDGFIELAEEEFNKTIRHRLMECRATAQMTTGDPFLELPGDFLEMRMVKVNTNPQTVMEFRTPTALDAEYIYTDDTGIPQSYTVTNTEMKVGPPPGSDYTIELMYFGKIPAIATATTNWLLTNYPSLYLSGCLIQASLFLRDKSLLGEWVTVYKNSFASLKSENDAAYWNAAALQTRPDFPVIY